jgi:hypothetical protein
MTIYYSPSRKGFFDSNFGYDSYPDDIIEITQEEYKIALSTNKSIALVDGKITFVEHAEVVDWNLVKAKRDRLLLKSDYTQLADWPGDKEAWAVYRQALRDLSSTFTNAEDVIWPTAPGE